MDDMPGMDMGKMHTVPPPEQMPVPVKMTGIGNAHITITATPEAQMWFDQGLNLLHDFWDYESTKAFEQGVRVDPKCAMCFWGLAQIEGFRGGPESVRKTENSGLGLEGPLNLMVTDWAPPGGMRLGATARSFGFGGFVTSKMPRRVIVPRPSPTRIRRR